MKTEYKALWVDDKHSTVIGEKKLIDNFLKTEGIKFTSIDVTIKPSWTAEKDEVFISAINDPELDIAFIDFNMAQDKNGAQIINFIRQGQKHYHLPIIFYTNETNALDFLQKKIFELNQAQPLQNILDGIYFCDRADISLKSIKILEGLLKKEEKPQRGRGLLMDRVSELEALVLKAIEKYWNKLPEDKKATIRQDFENKLQKRKADTENLIKIFNDDCSENFVKFIIDNKLKIDSTTRTILLCKILKHFSEIQPDIKTKLNTLCSGEPTSLFKIRNNYAHKTLKEIEPEHNKERCIYIRKETTAQLENIRKII